MAMYEGLVTFSRAEEIADAVLSAWRTRAAPGRAHEPAERAAAFRLRFAPRVLFSRARIPEAIWWHRRTAPRVTREKQRP